MIKDPCVEQLKAQLAAFEAKEDQLERSNKTLKNSNNSLLQDNRELEKSTQEMQRQIDLLISKLNLSNSKRFGKQSEKAPKGTFVAVKRVNRLRLSQLQSVLLNISNLNTPVGNVNILKSPIKW